MLVLTRKSQESVVVGGITGGNRTVTVTVLEIRGGSVRLGFEAPAKVTIHRLELSERLMKGKAGAAGVDGPQDPVDDATRRNPPAEEPGRPSRFGQEGGGAAVQHRTRAKP